MILKETCAMNTPSLLCLAIAMLSVATVRQIPRANLDESTRSWRACAISASLATVGVALAMWILRQGDAATVTSSDLLAQQIYLLGALGALTWQLVAIHHALRIVCPDDAPIPG